ncbi:MAG: hypothetical protein V3T72_10075 [Thermoanaerobaculia bacterium]
MRAKNEFPPGWDQQRIRDVLDYYESQTDDDAAAEHEAALSNAENTLMEVPAELFQLFRRLIAEHWKRQVRH